ncbi:lytic transglycosylase domain-containing protein [Roseivivax sediminis]|uniref:Soluble lytic murein transglycosylase n=1 Tax=Roseivivax sediminis TaxID=936889 RepID=A0A1I2A4G4_9RHOB|nr:lytic transglycosylase domain-containing protein [Roseivivax sediminis]SFE38821.1 soluble lytic murein transglycosylase [Roseivivax sediminis]
MSRLRAWLLLPFLLLAPLAIAPGPAVAQEARALGRAMDMMRQGDWAGALIEARGDGQVAVDVILWHYLRDGKGDAAQVQDFIDRNADWPGMDYLREKSEEAITTAPHADVRAFFADHLPQTGSGALSYARALTDAGEVGLAEVTIVLAWRTLALSAEETAAFLADHGDLLRPHHAARLDMTLWNGWTVNARRVVNLVDDGRRALAEARIALQDMAPGVDTKIAAVPERLTGDPGLAHDRFEWRVRKGRDDDAIDFLLERSTDAEALGEPAAWASRRRQLTRQTMRAGEHETAYRVAASHYMVPTGDYDYADLEWLSGYIALRFLDRPELAAEHFRNFRTSVDTPISLGRAGYWIGRAEEAAGNAEAAQEAYEFGGQYQTAFYGLLAAEKAGMPPDPGLSGAGPTEWQDAAFTESSVFRAAVMLLAANQDYLAERFFTHLSESLAPEEIARLGAMLEEMNRPHIQVMVGKRAAQAGLEVHGPYYAVPSFADRRFPVPTELVLAIARRESEFDPVVVSHAGARGLMQLMPGTARDVSGWIGETYSVSRLTSDPAYNARLGSAYLEYLARRFDGNIVMMAAGYNAGPGRPLQWMERFGDPREGEIDVIDFIESIPFQETQNYVMRVAESLPIYRARLGQDPHPVPFSEELTGTTLLPLGE